MQQILDGYSDGAIISKQHLEGDIPGDVRVIVKEGADQRKVVSTLLRIAGWIEAEAKAAERGEVRS